LRIDHAGVADRVERLTKRRPGNSRCNRSISDSSRLVKKR
jgi:hypothetical protein